MISLKRNCHDDDYALNLDSEFQLIMSRQSTTTTVAAIADVNKRTFSASGKPKAEERVCAPAIAKEASELHPRTYPLMTKACEWNSLP